MADNRLNLTGLRYFYNKLKVLFAKQADLTALSGRVDEIVAEGGEPNVIESISVNGTAVAPDANKNVALTVAQFDSNGAITDGANTLSVAFGTTSVTISNGDGDSVTIDPEDIPAATSKLTNDGDGNSPFATQAYVGQNGGKIDTISVNGTQQTITNKNVNITVPVYTSDLTNNGDGTTPFATTATATTSENGLMSSADKTKLDDIATGAEANVQSNWTDTDSTSDAFILNKPTKLSDFTNDGDGTTGSTFPTTAQMQTAIDAKISSAYKVKGSVAFANLPSLTAANEGNVYDVTDSFTTTADFAEGAGKTYPAGTNVVIINKGTEQSPVYKYDVLAGFVDLSDYWNSTNLTAITTAEIDAMMAS